MGFSFSKPTSKPRLSTAPIGHVHLSFNQFQLVKKRIRINFGIALLRHYITFYTGECNPKFCSKLFGQFA